MIGPLTVDRLECRPDKAYDEQNPATVIHPNGSVMKVGQRHDDLAAALVRAVLAEVWS